MDNRVVMISLPRSGSNLLMNTIRVIINDKIKIGKGICYSYNECNTVPCSCNPPALITKNHDFDMDIQINKDLTYIVILRKRSIISF